MSKATVKDIDVSNKKVLVRIDFNVPLDGKTGEITDDSRIRAVLPTINYLIGHGAKVILISHLGRPKGKVIESLRMNVAARRLSLVIGKEITTAKDCVGPEVENLVENMKSGDILFLENVRFYPEEEAGDESFAQDLARLGEIFVNDAFGAAHRDHASVSVIANYLPAVAGLLLEKEIQNLGSILENPAHPFIALLGGAKVSDKVGMLEQIMGKVDSVLIGGGMAATFLKAMSYEVGLSLVEEDRLETASRLMAKAAKENVRLLLPVDVVVADEISTKTLADTVMIDDIDKGKRIVDIGPKTIEIFTDELKNCKMLFWNGPLGIEEIPQFAVGTKAIAKLVAEIGAKTIIGGGSTAEVINRMGLADKMSFVSTGGGASLKFLGGNKMPGVERLLDKC